ncbi:MAG: phosphate ABC transporter permease PstA [Elainellaceae cyanobacterium]
MTYPAEPYAKSLHNQTGAWAPSIARRRTLNQLLTLGSALCLLLCLVPLVAVLGYVLQRGSSRLSGALFIALPPAAGMVGGGAANAILGTLTMVGIATLISVPVGILAAVYLSEAGAPAVARLIRFAANVLSGVPSIIAGIFAYGLVVLNTGGFSAIAGGIALSVLMVPVVVRTTDEALRLVPQDMRWAAIAVGASRYQVVLQVVLPAALPAIVTGVSLAIARAAGEAAPLLFTALFSFYYPSGLWEPTASLAVMVYNFATSPYPDQQAIAWAASLVLVLLVLLSSITVRWATWRKP